MDPWVPTPEGKYILVVIDQLTRFPEVAVVNSTGPENLGMLEKIFSRQGIPKSYSDNGMLFNIGGTISNSYLRREGI